MRDRYERKHRVSLRTAIARGYHDSPRTDMAATPDAIKPHAPDYKDHSWELYTMQELGEWVHLLAKRAEHRDNPEKRAKDLYDAQNYLTMMQAKLDALSTTARAAKE